MTKSVAIELAGGGRMYVDPADGRGVALLEAGGRLNPWSHTLWSMLLTEQAWTMIVDVGTNFGEMLAGHVLPSDAEIVAVEPNPDLQACLGRTLAQLGQPARLVPVAVSDRAGTVVLNLDQQWSGLSSLEASVDQQGPTRPVEVEALRLPDLFQAAPSVSRILLKIDVEGHEGKVLDGVASAFDRFAAFAAMVEIRHMDDAMLHHLSSQFEVEILNRTTHRLETLAGQANAGRHPGDYYWDDAVFRLKPASR